MLSPETEYERLYNDVVRLRRENAKLREEKQLLLEQLHWQKAEPLKGEPTP